MFVESKAGVGSRVSGGKRRVIYTVASPIHSNSVSEELSVEIFAVIHGRDLLYSARANRPILCHISIKVITQNITTQIH